MHDADDYIRSYGNPRQYELARGDVSELVGNVKRTADQLRSDRVQQSQVACEGRFKDGSASAEIRSFDRAPWRLAGGRRPFTSARLLHRTV